MFTLLTGAALVMAAATPATDQDETHEYCMLLSSIAETIMDRRQSGVPMSKMVGVMINGNLNEPTQKYAIAMITHAYKQSRYSSQEYRAQETQEFADTYYSACLVEYPKAMEKSNERAN